MQDKVTQEGNWSKLNLLLMKLLQLDMTNFGKIAYFSSRGEKVEWAPIVGIYSTYLNNGYASLSGTSMELVLYYRYLFDDCKAS